MDSTCVTLANDFQLLSHSLRDIKDTVAEYARSGDGAYRDQITAKLATLSKQKEEFHSRYETTVTELIRSWFPQQEGSSLDAISVSDEGKITVAMDADVSDKDYFPSVINILKGSVWLGTTIKAIDRVEQAEIIISEAKDTFSAKCLKTFSDRLLAEASVVELPALEKGSYLRLNRALEVNLPRLTSLDIFLGPWLKRLEMPQVTHLDSLNAGNLEYIDISKVTQIREWGLVLPYATTIKADSLEEIYPYLDISRYTGKSFQNIFPKLHKLNSHRGVSAIVATKEMADELEALRGNGIDFEGSVGVWHT